METIKSINQAFRFILELCALAAFGYWGIQTGKAWYIKAIFGIGAPLLAGVIWGTFGRQARRFLFEGSGVLCSK